jgi:pilus assembly protein CpaF
MADVRHIIAQAVDLIVVVNRQRDGSRRIMDIVEVAGSGPTRYRLTTLFTFEQTGVEPGEIKGRIYPTGAIPGFLTRIEKTGIHLPPSVFGRWSEGREVKQFLEAE